MSFEQTSDPTKLEGWVEAAADSACRADAIDTALFAAPSALEAFTAKNAGAIADVSAGWAKAPAELTVLRDRFKQQSPIRATRCG